MKWIIYTVGVLIISSIVSLFAGAFIRAGSGESNKKGRKEHADHDGN